jgi:tetratricopeptide (TPR) repeat protein
MKNLFIPCLLLICSWAFPQRNEQEWINAFGNYESGDFSVAIDAFSHLQTISKPEEQKISLYKGISEFKLHEYSQALSDFRILSDQGIQDGIIWLARTYAVIADKQNALLSLERYLQSYQEIGRAHV